MNESLDLIRGGELGAEQVRDYLLRNPEFFNQYPELLDDIQLSDKRGGVVSLTMRQLAQLREKNEIAYQQLDGLLEIARENDALFGRMQKLTSMLMAARCVEDVFACLDDSLRECFSADFFAIRLLADEGAQSFPVSDVIWQQDSPHLDSFKRFLAAQQIKCGHPTHTQAAALFADQAPQVKSVALIPLMIGQKEGVFAIGSQDSERFHPAMGTLFLAHLGELVSKRLVSLLPVAQDV